jgi:hypothetical protein
VLLGSVVVVTLVRRGELAQLIGDQVVRRASGTRSVEWCPERPER